MSTPEYVSTDSGSLDDVMVLIKVREYVKDAEGPYLGQQVRYWCIGCNSAHQIPVRPWAGKGDSWEWNGRVDDGVVLKPSQLSRSYWYPNPEFWPDKYTEKDEQEFEAYKAAHPSFDAMVQSKWRAICHTFIGINGAPPGHIIFLNDCFMHGAPFPVNGQVHKLLPRRDWPESASWAAHRAVKGAPPDPS